MNREIKFRGMSEKGMVYGDLIHDEKGSTAYYDTHPCRIAWKDRGGYCSAPIKKGTEGQFTGLKDNNGREIYEGDVVVWFGFDGERYQVIYDRWGIPALAGVFNCEAYDFKELEMCHNATSNKCEVIGNIYENPELLK